MEMQGWNKRNVKYEEIHNVSSEDLLELAKALKIEENHTFADLMCGYGAVTKALLELSSSKGINFNPILIDFCKEQLDRVNGNLLDGKATLLCEDVRNLSLKENSVDRIAIKMGVHEVPRDDQFKVIKNAYNALKPGGILVVWDIMPKDKIGQLVFQTIIREKDRLSEFFELTFNRYFPREDELRNYLSTAGFEKIELVKEIPYNFSSEKRLYAELGGDKNKLAKWNEFIRAIVPDEIKESIQFKDTGNSIDAVFRKGILRAVKPKSNISGEIK